MSKRKFAPFKVAKNGYSAPLNEETGSVEQKGEKGVNFHHSFPPLIIKHLQKKYAKNVKIFLDY